MVSAECLRPRNPPIRPRGALRTAYATTGLSNARLLSRWACWARTLGMEASLLQYRITTTGSPRLTAHRAASQDPDRNSKGGNTTSPVNRGSHPSRACARRSRPAPRLEGGLTYRPGLDRAPAQPLRHGHSQAREGERVDPGPLGRRAEPGSRKFGSRGGSREPARRGNAFRGRHRRCGGARGRAGPLAPARHRCAAGGGGGAAVRT